MDSVKFIIGKGSCGIAAGADKTEAALRGLFPGAVFSVAGCIGTCYLEPIIDMILNGRRHTFVKADVKCAEEIAKFARGAKNEAEKYFLPDEDKKILQKQKRLVLKNCGLINPEDIDEYIKTDGYEALRACLGKKTPEKIISELKKSGLAGRGGAGFPTWFKWEAARKTESKNKYVICNADEGDPGAFMDRAIIEGDPHAVIEGMAIAAYAIGSKEGFVYVRAEYPLAVKRLVTAIGQARQNNFLGKNIMGTEFSFDIEIKEGAGAFVCGEETALIASVEGERGIPRIKPPYPAERGYLGMPTNINNVETYANVPSIILNNGDTAADTKVFALSGKIKKCGLAEISMGSTISDLVYGLGGGAKDGKKIKAVQIGGPSGGCIPKRLFDTPIDYKSLTQTGAIMGSGGIVAVDEETCMVDMAKFFLEFTCKESCGKCTHCRIGTKRLHEILQRITNGDGVTGDIEKLEFLCGQIKEGALCQLGQTAPNPVVTTLRYFRGEYEDHINKKCTAKSCKPLLVFAIDEKLCKKCGACKRVCPVDAVCGEKGKPYAICASRCTACGKCKTVCKFNCIAAGDRFGK